MIGEGFVGQPGIKLNSIHIPVLSDIPFLGPVLFGQDLIAYVSFALIIGVCPLVFVQDAGRPDTARRRR